MFNFTDQQQDIAILALAGALLLDFITGTAFGVLAITTGLEDWLINFIQSI